MSQIKKGWKKWFVAGLVLLLVAYVTYSWLRHRANLPLSGYDWSYTADTEVVNLQVGPHRFAIPKNYLFKSGTRKDGVYNYFTVVLLMPEFKPYSEALKEEFHRGGAPLMFIDINTRGSDPEMTQVFNKRTSNGRYKLQPDSKAPGLQKFLPLSPSQFEIYAEIDGGQVKHFLDCTRIAEASSPSCRVQIDYSNEVVIYYRLKQIYLDRWQWADEQVRALLAGWERNGAQDKR